jgi:hypothetical protein
MVTIEHNPNSEFSKTRLTNFDLNTFKMIEAMGLEIIASKLS